MPAAAEGVDKGLVKKRFASCFNTYKDNAIVQQEMARDLLDMVSALGRREYKTILEIGCHTGLMTTMAAKRFRYDQYLLNDLVEECAVLEGRIKGGRFLWGDAESCSFPDSLDLVISNAAFQWFSDLPGMLDRLYDRMAPGAVLAFSTFGPENASEIRDLLGVSLSYPEQEKLKDLVAERFTLHAFTGTLRRLHFDHPMAVLRHLKRTGVTGVSNRSWTRSAMGDFLRDYEKKFSRKEGGVGLTYNPLLVCAVKSEGGKK